MNNTEERIQQRLQEITVEIQELSAEKVALGERAKQIETRLTQCIGAAYELKKLLEPSDPSVQATPYKDSASQDP